MHSTVEGFGQGSPDIKDSYRQRSICLRGMWETKGVGCTLNSVLEATPISYAGRAKSMRGEADPA